MTIFLYKRLIRNLEIGNIPVWVFLNIWRVSWVRDTKFGTNVSNEKLLNAANFQDYRFYTFWVITGKPTGVKLLPIQITDNIEIIPNSWCANLVERFSFRRISGEFPETLRKPCLSTKFPHQEIRRNFGVLRSEVQKVRCSNLCGGGWIYFEQINIKENSSLLFIGLMGMKDSKEGTLLAWTIYL